MPKADNPPQPGRLSQGASDAEVQAVFEHGFALHQAGRLAEAQAIYEKVLEARPDHFDALYSLGIVAAQSKHPAAAAELIGRAIALNPNFAEAHFNRGNLLHHLDRPEEALASFGRAIELNPDYVEVHFNRALVLQKLSRPEEALAGFDRVVRLQPGNAEAQCGRGAVLKDLNRFLEALAAFETALELRPDDAPAWNNRGNLLKELGRADDALASYDRAIALAPGDADAHYNRANVLQDLGRPEEALGSYERAVELKPDFVLAQYNLAVCRLAMGDFTRGWQGYEWRWKRRQVEEGGTRDFTAPLWLGEAPLAGRTILLHGEQGLGDTIQFCRYAAMVRDLGARVILEVPEPLIGLLGQLDGISQLVARGSPLPAFDYHCPLMSLPLALKTRLETIPPPARYIAGDPARVAAWRDRLGPKARPRVGLAWSGDAWNTPRLHRSIGLALMRSILRDDIEWFSLHKEVHAIDAQALASCSDIRHFGAEMTFTETAALAELMDLVISIDTSIAHLAGSIGKPVWILLPFRPDWRWLLHREDSPWYPSARLFRQEARGDWATVLRDVKLALQTWVSAAPDST